MLKSFSQMHCLGIVHNEIHFDNIFCDYDDVTNKVQCYLGNFGLANLQSIKRDYVYDKYYPNEYITTKYDI